MFIRGLILKIGVLFLSIGIAKNGISQHSITGVGSGNTYTQDFNAFAGTSGTVPSNWAWSYADYDPGGYYNRNGSYASQNSTYGLRDNPSATDIAFGAKIDNTNRTMTFSAVNNTGASISGFVITCNVEQYSHCTNDTPISFTYRIGAGSYGTTGVSGITVVNASTSGTCTNLGSISTTPLSITISGITVANAETVDFRFTFGDATSNNAHIGIDDFTVYGTASCTPPSNQATDFSATNITTSQLDVNWLHGMGGTHVLVVARQGSAVNTNPTNGTSYTANAAFGSGDQIGTGNYVVYNGTGTSVTVTNLSPATTYHFAIYEYNNSGFCYLTPPLAGNAMTNAAAATITHSGTTPLAANILQGSTDNILYQIQITVATATAILNQVIATTAGTWVTADISNFKLRYSTDATLNAGDATLATLTSGYSGGAGDITFSSLSQSIPVGVVYLFITCDVASGATIGNTIRASVDADGDFTYSVAPNYSGSSFLSPNTMTIVGLPELQLEHPVGTNVDCNFTLAFGSVNLGYNSSLTVRIRNTGTADLNLTNLPLTISGTNANQFSITTQPSASIAAGNFSDMVVRFTPTSTGGKMASISISNNDGSENPCTISLSGTGTVGGLYFRSKVSGNWASSGSWETSLDNSSWIDAATSPTDANLTVTIFSGHTMTINSNTSIDETTVNSGGTIDVTAGTLTIANVSMGTDLSVSGTLRAATAITMTGTLVIQNGGVYQHNPPGSGVAVPTATWNTGSTCQIINGTAAPGGLNQTFHHFVWNFPNPGTINISGDLDNVLGNFTIVETGGALRLTGSTSNTLNVSGNVIIEAGAELELGNGGATSSLIIGGDLEISGGTLDLMGAGSSNGTVQLSGDLIMSSGSITETNTGTSHVIQFVGSSEQLFIKSGGTISNDVDFTIASGAIVNFSTYVLSGGSGSFTLASGGTLKTAHASGIAGTVAVSGTKTFNAAANYEFQTGSTGNTGISTANNVTLNHASGITLDVPLTVNGTLTFTSGILNTGSSQLLTLGSSATVSGASSTRYVSGPLAKTTASTSVFTFPIGKGGQYRTLAIEPSSTSSTTFTAEFFYSAPSNSTSFTPPVEAIHSLEYFDLARTGSAGAKVTLSYEAPAGFIGSTNDLLVAHYNNGAWNKEGTTPIVSGNTTSGTITTDNYVSVFSPFAVGSSNAASSPLPVELIDFQAKVAGSKVLLNWTTASENQLAMFYVEKTENPGRLEFAEIGSKDALGANGEINHYQMEDAAPSTTNFYKLRMVDFDGTSTYSKVISVNFQPGNQISLHPNPLSGNDLTLLLPDEYLEESLHLEIFTHTGQRIKSIAAQPESELQLDLTDLLPGAYFLKAISGARAETLKFLRQ